MSGVDALPWPDRIECHGQPVDWQIHRDGRRKHCPVCRSVDPRWVFETFAPLARSRAPWLDPPCVHEAHADAGELADCERVQLDRIAAWSGMVLSEAGGGFEVWLYAPRSNGIGQQIFQAAHLLDLVPLTFDAVAGVIAAHTGVRFLQAGDGLSWTAEPE